MPSVPDRLLCLAGDVMTGRGVDQILRHPGARALREPCVDDALTYVELAEQRSGHVPRSVDPAYVWGDALSELARTRPDARIVNLETSITVSDEFWPRKERWLADALSRISRPFGSELTRDSAGILLRAA